MTTKELVEKIDGTTRGKIIEQAYDFGFEDGYEMGSRILGMSLEEFVKTNNKPVGVIDHPKHIIVNGALYEKIDDSVLMITNGIEN